MFTTASDFYKEKFGSKVYKISLDAGCTCPNRDGTKGYGGCIFCSQKGSGDFIPENTISIQGQLVKAKNLVKSKLPEGKNKYIAYFQNFTNTYGNLSRLEEKWQQALCDKEVVGLAIGTRPDCLSEDCLKLLNKLSKNTFIQLELGFQTANEDTAKFINRCYENEVYFDAVKRIKEFCPKLHLVTHVIFGLPGETEADMLNTIKTVVAAGTDGIKITVLYVLKNTPLEKLYNNGSFTCLTQEEYLGLLKKALAVLPENIIIHRLTGDPPKSLLTAPLWTTDKKRMLNKIKTLLADEAFRSDLIDS